MRKRTARKVWVLAPGVLPMEHARYQASRLTTAEWNTQVQPVVVAIDQLSQGQWDPWVNWQPMFMCLNRIESMLKLKRADGHGLIDDAQAVFVAALDRQKATGATSLKADELRILREVSQVYGDLLKEVTHKEFQDACNHTDANVQRIVRQKGNVYSQGGCLVERKKQAVAA